jgi:hypothetical protein
MHHFIKISNYTPYYKAYMSKVWKIKTSQFHVGVEPRSFWTDIIVFRCFNKSNYFKHKCIYWLVADFKIEIIDITAPLVYRAWLFVWIQWSIQWRLINLFHSVSNHFFSLSFTFLIVHSNELWSIAMYQFIYIELK